MSRARRHRPWRGGAAARLVALALVVAGTGASAQVSSCDPARARAAVSVLNEALLAQPSASVTLTQWCRANGLMGPDDKLRAVLVADSNPAGEDVRRELQAAPGEAVGYRHVQLRCGAHLVSDAENWFVPSRLTPAMNEELATTDHPFGLVVKALDFTRRRLDERPAIAAADPPPAPSATVLQHRATLVARSGQPFSLVLENYKADLVCHAGP
ncbi:MAG: hypothetical protein U1E62_16825 [Alsobacter sp.]